MPSAKIAKSPVRLAMLAILEAKPGKENEVAKFLSEALAAVDRSRKQ